MPEASARGSWKHSRNAESCAEPDRRAAFLTIVIVGGGPTGVEMAGTVAELARYTLRGNFRRIDPTQARVVLVEAGPRLLAAFPEELGSYSAIALQRLGVEVRLNSTVEQIDKDGVQLAGEWMAAATVIWGAAVFVQRRRQSGWAAHATAAAALPSTQVWASRATREFSLWATWRSSFKKVIHFQRLPR
jgi:NADH dehydrogenase FAD-containing subunit